MDFGRKYRGIIIVLFFFTIGEIKAQDTLNTAFVEKQSYKLYLDKNWNELIKFGNKAIKNDFDYYYLRFRLGTAYFEQKKYLLASTQFQRALKFYSGDNLSKEYLYYCYIYTGRYDDARVLSKSFDNNLAQKTGTDKQSSLSFIQLEGGIKQSDKANYPHLNSHNDDTHKNDLINDTSIYKNVTYFQLGLGHYIKNRISLFHAFTYFSQENTHSKNETFTNDIQNTPLFGNDTIKFKSTDKTTQFQYYLNANIPLKNNWNISPAFHFIHKNVSSQVDTSSAIKHPAIAEESISSNSKTSTSKENYYIGSISIQKNVNRFSFAFGSAMLYGILKETNLQPQPPRMGGPPPRPITVTTTLPSVTLFQSNLTVEYSILGNSRIVIGCTGYINYTSKSTVLAPYIIAHPTYKITLMASYLTNSGDNVLEANAYLINNSTDNTVSRYAFTCGFQISRHIDLYAQYVYENKIESKQSFKYNYNGFFAGIRIKNFNKFTNPKNN